MSVGEAVAEALKAVVPDRRIVEAEEITGIPHSSIRRLIGSQKKVSADTILKLRRYPGFSAVFDRLIGNVDPAPGYIEAAKMLASVGDENGAALIAFHIGSLTQNLDFDNIVDLLKSEAERLAKARARQPV